MESCLSLAKPRVAQHRASLGAVEGSPGPCCGGHPRLAVARADKVSVPGGV